MLEQQTVRVCDMCGRKDNLTACAITGPDGHRDLDLCPRHWDAISRVLETSAQMARKRAERGPEVRVPRKVALPPADWPVAGRPLKVTTMEEIQAMKAAKAAKAR